MTAQPQTQNVDDTVLRGVIHSADYLANIARDNPSLVIEELSNAGFEVTNFVAHADPKSPSFLHVVHPTLDETLEKNIEGRGVYNGVYASKP